MEANLSIIASLRSFLSDAAKNPQYKQRPTDFTRERSLTMKCVALLILSALRRTLDVELVDFFKEIESHRGVGAEPRAVGVDFAPIAQGTDAAPTKSAFSQARYKLSTLFLSIGLPVF
jgi:hypothetical protein